MHDDLTGESLAALGDRVVAQARHGEEIEVVAVRSAETDVRAWDGGVESFASATADGVGIRVVIDQRQGFAHCGSHDEAIVAETLAEARDNAAFGTPDEFLGVAAPDGVSAPNLELWRPELAEVAPETKIDLALELERAALAGDRRIRGVESADYADTLSVGAVVTTSGIRSIDRSSGCHLSVFSVASAGEDTQTGFGFSVGRGLDELDVQEAAEGAVERAVRLLGARKPATTRTTVVFDPWVTAQFLGLVGATLSGEAVVTNRSLFADRLGEPVASTRLSLTDDPTDAAAFGAGPFDGEGLATRRNELIGAGVLQRFLHNSYTARRVGTASTGSAVRGYASVPGVGAMALAVAPGDCGAAELVAGIEDGVLVQEVSGLHSGVNLVSGDFSTGAEGLRIRNGELAEPIREFTVASTLQRMLLDVVAVGSDLTRLPMTAAGVTLVVADVTVSGE
ncbi:MAG: TldD/PmbA family protein [bacterium]|nr:TldD/PmbA family protein [bacterium]MDE0667608.1 TldD/PmbA family protein [bacterium]MXZ30761.1 TldD/PmbA family protein [Acidimicrobiia bacterium]MYB24727.1 TldD/PmbA family protein [Acidimicrobiia bacterium]MYJ13140.1 TldD/PmbA family protein [Acidimicrobiia bacterium]